MVSSQICSPASTSTRTFEDSLACEITEALRNTGYSELEQLEVIVDGHDICVQGSVSRFFLRQKAEFAILSLPSVSTFRSRIEVQR